MSVNKKKLIRTRALDGGKIVKGGRVTPAPSATYIAVPKPSSPKPTSSSKPNKPPSSQG